MSGKMNHWMGWPWDGLLYNDTISTYSTRNQDSQDAKHTPIINSYAVAFCCLALFAAITSPILANISSVS